MRTLHPHGKQPRWLRRLMLLAFLFVALLGLSGCVRYDVGVQVEGQYRGVITQHIQLGEPLTNFSQREVQQWLQTLERRAKTLHGSTKHLGDAELLVTIPYSNGQELRDRFNQFFDPPDSAVEGTEPSEENLVELTAGLGFIQSNFLLLERDRLSLDVDLRGLGNLGDSQDLIVNTNDVLELKFALQTPWGATVSSENQIPYRQEGQQLLWQLTPGQVNHLEAVFWLPSRLGLGTVGIVGIVMSGAWLKTRLSPNASTKS